MQSVFFSKVVSEFNVADRTLNEPMQNHF